MANEPNDSHTWRRSYASTTALSARLAAVQSQMESVGPFGMDVVEEGWVAGRAVLNIGCGTGIHDAKLLAGLSVPPRRYVLLDPSEAMLSEAAPLVRGRVEDVFTVRDAFPSTEVAGYGPFDLIVLMHVLYHVDDPTAALLASAKLLADGGAALLTTVSAENNRELWAHHDDVLRTNFGMEPQERVGTRFDSQNALDLVSTAFSRVECFPRRAALNFTDVDAALGYYRAFPYVAQLPDEVRDGLVAEVGERISAALREHGVFSVSKSSITLVARQPWEVH